MQDQKGCKKNNNIGAEEEQTTAARTKQHEDEEKDTGYNIMIVPTLSGNVQTVWVLTRLLVAADCCLLCCCVNCKYRRTTCNASCLRLEVKGLPAAAGKRLGSDPRRRSYSWWYCSCSLVLVLLWSVVSRTHAQPSSGKRGMLLGNLRLKMGSH